MDRPLSGLSGDLMSQPKQASARDQGKCDK
jgi:hypothetical protein